MKNRATIERYLDEIPSDRIIPTVVYLDFHIVEKHFFSISFSDIPYAENWLSDIEIKEESILKKEITKRRKDLYFEIVKFMRIYKNSSEYKLSIAKPLDRILPEVKPLGCNLPIGKPLGYFKEEPKEQKEPEETPFAKAMKQKYLEEQESRNLNHKGFRGDLRGMKRSECNYIEVKEDTKIDPNRTCDYFNEEEPEEPKVQVFMVDLLLSSIN